MNRDNYTLFRRRLEEATRGVKGYVNMHDATEAIVGEMTELCRQLKYAAENEERKNNIRAARDLYLEIEILSFMMHECVTDKVAAFAMDRITELKRKALLAGYTQRKIRSIPQLDGRNMSDAFDYGKERGRMLYTPLDETEECGRADFVYNALKQTGKDIRWKEDIATDADRENFKTMLRARKDENEGRFYDALLKYVDICIVSAMISDVDPIRTEAEIKAHELGRMLSLGELRKSVGGGLRCRRQKFTGCCCNDMVDVIEIEDAAIAETPMGPMLVVDSAHRPSEINDGNGRSLLIDSEDGKRFMTRRCPYCGAPLEYAEEENTGKGELNVETGEAMI